MYLLSRQDSGEFDLKSPVLQPLADSKLRVRKMLNRFTRALALMFSLILSINASAEGNNEAWIEPGRSIANMKIDSSYSDIIQLLGQAQEIEGSTLFFNHVRVNSPQLAAL